MSNSNIAATGDPKVNESDFGVLEQGDVRRVWEHEANDFTPWLAMNLDRLGNELNIELELEGKEVFVGDYPAGRESRTNRESASLNSQDKHRH